ncbi:MAG: transglutaminase-like domain-containing protein, partial [Proteobacteria bacterium]|nr:transglutaminase-like domain-containing protein [Pseudomonadota bacterium]
SGVARFIVSGQVNGRKLALKVDTAGRKEEKVLELKDTPFLSYHVKPFLLSQGLAVGKRYRRQFFDPSTLSNNEVLLEVEGKEKMVSKKKEITAYRIRESFKGFTVTSWVSEDGETVKEESPLGFVLKSETKEEALSKLPEGRGTDIIELSAVPVSGLIGKPYPRYLKVRMKGIGFEDSRVQGFKVEGGRQTVKGDVVEIAQEDLKNISSYSIPYRKNELKIFCEPSLLVQSDDQVIVSEAKNIVGKERDAVRVVKMLLNWMHDNIEKRPTMSIPSAREVLKMRVGDCNEHAALFTAFARSLGIPARICGGIVYSRGSFYYHAWDEVFLQDWVSVDPLMNQFPADATHIKLVEGDLDKQLPLLGLLGKLKVEVVEYR